MYRMKGKIDDRNLDLYERYILARYCYRVGIPYWDDAFYDKVNSDFMRINPNDRYVRSSYDDDPVPFEILIDAGFAEEDIRHLANMVRVSYEQDDPCVRAYREALQERESKSIVPYFRMEEAYKAMESLAGNELCLSVKIDGIKGISLYSSFPDKRIHKFCYATTRGGKEGNPINITKNISRILPTSVPLQFGINNLIIEGEVLCIKSAIEWINRKHGINLKVPRSAALSMIQTDEYDNEDYNYLVYLVHNFPLGSTLSEGFEIAKELGFEVVPYRVYQYTSKSFAEFRREIAEIISEMKAIADESDFKSDGLVVSLNSRSELLRLSKEGLYDGGILSLKIGEWEPGVYRGKVLSVSAIQQAENFSFKLNIAPVRTDSGVTVSTLNMYNLAAIVANDIEIGDMVEFEYKNETTPLFRRKVVDE